MASIHQEDATAETERAKWARRIVSAVDAGPEAVGALYAEAKVALQEAAAVEKNPTGG